MKRIAALVMFSLLVFQLGCALDDCHHGHSKCGSHSKPSDCCVQKGCHQKGNGCHQKGNGCHQKGNGCHQKGNGCHQKGNGCHQKGNGCHQKDNGCHQKGNGCHQKDNGCHQKGNGCHQKDNGYKGAGKDDCYDSEQQPRTNEYDYDYDVPAPQTLGDVGPTPVVQPINTPLENSGLVR